MLNNNKEYKNGLQELNLGSPRRAIHDFLYRAYANMTGDAKNLRISATFLFDENIHSRKMLKFLSNFTSIFYNPFSNIL